MLISEYRIVRYYHQFFNHWAVRLEKKQVTRLFWWTFTRWERVCNNSFDDIVPKDWRAFNIVEEITLNELEIC